MKKKLIGAKALLRLSATFPNALILTIVGILASNGYFGWRALIIFLANWLTPAFACAINDVEDADDDAQDEKKCKRNPLCNGSLTRKEGWIISMSYGILAIILYIIVGLSINNYDVIWFGVSGVVVAFFYSWKLVRFKSIPVIDLLSHAFMLSAAQFTATYFAFNPHLTTIGMMLVIASYLISINGDLENENRDFEIDKKTHITNTAQFLGSFNRSRALQVVNFICFIGVMVYIIVNITININLILIAVGATIAITIILVVLKLTGIFKETIIGILNASVQLGVLSAIAYYIIT